MTPIEAKITEANILLQMQDYQAASYVLLEVFEEDPYNLSAIDTLFLLFYQSKNFQMAVTVITPIIEKIPDPARISNRGLALFEMRRFKDALDDYNAAIKLDPNHAIAWNNKADALKALDRYDEAIVALERSMELDPTFIMPLLNMGQVASDLGDYEKANEYFIKGLLIDEGSPELHFAYALNLLKTQNYIKGFEEYEYRWKAKVGLPHKRHFHQPQWHKYLTLKDKNIFIYVEQGFGDAIQMSRFFKVLADKGAKVFVEADPAIADLLRTVEGVHEIVAPRALPAEKLDYQLPIMSLPYQLDLTPETIPSADGYIKADPEKVKEWAERLGPKKAPRIGIVWSSKSDFTHDHKRSMSFNEFVKCLPKGPEYICLQPFIKESDKPAMSTRIDIKLVGDKLTTFSDTAALIENLDLVVSTCTSVPHLAGAMGKETWIIIPFSADWRWHESGTTTPWYSSVKLFRQTDVNSWAGILHQVKEQIAKYK